MLGNKSLCYICNRYSPVITCQTVIELENTVREYLPVEAEVTIHNCPEFERREIIR